MWIILRMTKKTLNFSAVFCTVSLIPLGWKAFACHVTFVYIYHVLVYNVLDLCKGDHLAEPACDFYQEVELI